MSTVELDPRSGDRVAFRASSLAGVELMTARLPRYAFPRHSHDRIGLGLMLTGGHDSLYGFRRRIVAPGQVMVVNAGEVHDGAPIGAEGRAYVLGCFAPAVIAEGLADAAGEAGIDGPFDLAPSVEADAGVARLIRRCLDALLPGVDPLDRDQRLAALFAALARHAGRRPAEDAAAMDPLVRRLKERLAATLDEPLSIAALAAEAGVSRYVLIRRFARSVGLTPYAWRVQRRVEAARAALAAGLAPAEAAAAFGFADQAHLTRLFRRQFGLPPGRYAAGSA